MHLSKKKKTFYPFTDINYNSNVKKITQRIYQESIEKKSVSELYNLKLQHPRVISNLETEKKKGNKQDASL